MSEFGEDYVGFEDLSSRKKAKRIITTLTVVLLLVFVICLIFIVLFALEKSKVHEQETQELPPQHQTCVSKRCVSAAVGKFTCNSLISYFYSVPCVGSHAGADIEFKGVRELFIAQRQLKNQKSLLYSNEVRLFFSRPE